MARMIASMSAGIAGLPQPLDHLASGLRCGSVHRPVRPLLFRPAALLCPLGCDINIPADILGVGDNVIVPGSLVKRPDQSHGAPLDYPQDNSSRFP